ncbi:MAG: hypothetical protein J1F17_06045 [Oscillospiraceae bacterium]|nr:hypothetical protein [Oscillospiraceae bacterium]
MAVDGYLNFDTKIDTTGFNKDTRSMSNNLKGFTSQLIKLGSAIGAAFGVRKLVQLGKQAKENADIQIEAETKLTTVMKQRMGATDANIKSIEKLASAQQALGVVGDEVQLSGAQQLATFLKTDTALKRLIPAMNNLAVQQNGVNVTSESMKNIGNLMGKAMQGQASALTRVGITFDETQEKILKYGTEEEKAATLAQVITDNVGEMNKAIASMPAGQLQQVKNNFGDVTEILGRCINNVLTPMLSVLGKIVGKLGEMASWLEEVTKKIFGDSNSSAAVYSSVADSTSDITSNIEDSTNAQNNLTKAVKKTNKEIDKGLASYDELNVLQDNTTADTSSGNTVDAANNAGIQAGKQVADKTSKGITDGLSKCLKNLYENSGLDKFVDKIQKGIDSVNWSNIGNNFKSIFSDLQPIAKATFKGLQKVGKSAFDALGSYIGGWISVSGKQFETLSGGIAKWLNKDKSRIVKYIDNVSDNFATGFDNISKLYDSVFGSMGKSIDKMRPKVKKSISNLLSNFTTFGISIGTVVSDAFRISTDVIADWAVDNEATITEMFDNIQLMFCDVANLVGDIFGDIGTIISDWWNGDGGGSSIFENVCEMFTNIGTTMMNVFNEWIKPAWDFIVGVAKSAWGKFLKPIFNSVLKFFGKLCDAISTVWNNFLSPVVNWLIKTLKPVFVNVFNAVKGVFDTVFETVGGVISGIFDALGGLLDFITGVFSLDFKKAWKGIKSFFKGIWDGIWSIVKGVINLIIDGLNLLWSGIYTVVSGIINGIGGIAGFIGDIFGCDREFSMPDEPPLIPKLATGTVVPASYGEFMAILGDNKREPEVVSPLSTIKQAVKEAFAEGGFTTGNGEINLTINLDGEAVYKSVVKHDKANVKRCGTSAFAY